MNFIETNIKNHIEKSETTKTNSKMTIKTPDENKELCKGCNICCQYAVIELKTPETKKDLELISWYLLHNIVIFIENDGNWCAEIKNKCISLNNQGLCSIYNTRPEICREYGQEECEKNKGEEHGIKHTFKTQEEFLEYIENNSELKKISKKLK